MGAGEPQEHSRSSMASPSACVQLLPGRSPLRGAGGLPRRGGTAMLTPSWAPCRCPAEHGHPFFRRKQTGGSTWSEPPGDSLQGKRLWTAHFFQKGGNSFRVSTSGAWPVGELWALCVFPRVTAHVIHRRVRAPMALLKTLCGSGTQRNLADSFPLILPSSQIPYLALVAASFVALAAADAFVLVFSSE